MIFIGIRKNPRLILNKIKWTKEFDLKKITIYYLHRGANDNKKIVYGIHLKSIEKSFIETNTSSIPYHRILKIEYGNKVIFDRKKI